MTDDNLTIAYMSGYHDAKSKYADEIERLREALRECADQHFYVWGLAKKCSMEGRALSNELVAAHTWDAKRRARATLGEDKK
jgi:hypothetical protein